MKLQVGDVLLVYDRISILSKMIWWFSKKINSTDRVTHAAMYVGGGMIVDNLPGGVVIINIEYYLNNPKFDIFILRSRLPIDKDIIVESAMRDAGIIKYNYFSLVRHALRKYNINIKYKESCRRICSNYVVYLLRQAGLDLLPGKKLHSITPADILHSKKLELIFLTKQLYLD